MSDHKLTEFLESICLALYLIAGALFGIAFLLILMLGRVW